MKTALITGVTGQAGSYLSALLLEKGYRVVGTTRDIRLAKRSQSCNVELVSLDLMNYDQVTDLIDKLRPDEVYHFAAPSSVARSFGDPVKAVTGITIAGLNLLASIRNIDERIRFLDAGSIEIFGECGAPVDESTRLSPHSPYGVGKSSSYLQTRNFREAYNLFACSAIFSNFESPLRSVSFVTAKIVSTACQIAAGEDVDLGLGNIGIFRDWGWAPEYMEAAWRMLQLDEPEDLVIATGIKHSLKEFLEIVFRTLDIDLENRISSDPYLLRPLDIQSSVGNPARAKESIQWSAKYSIEDLIQEWVNVEMKRNWPHRMKSRTLYSIAKPGNVE
jgi:GDPmannose 4,6-dehydratase